MTIRLISSRAAAPVTALLMLAVAGCSLADKSAPPLAGPSTFALSVTLVATPDRIPQDGKSKTTITAFVRDVSNQPIAGLPIQWAVIASDGRTFVEPSWRTSPTDGSGQTTVEITAPAAPEALPLAPLSLTVTATPLSADAANSVPRQVVIGLQPPQGTLPINILPVPSFTLSPSTAVVLQRVTVDASQTRDEGLLCNDNCTYRWDFGDGTTGTGRVTTHAYAAAGAYTITLTVTDSRGGIATRTGSVVITQQVPTFTVSPSAAMIQQTVTVDASETRDEGVLCGDACTYEWDFGDGATERGRVETHAYESTGTYTITLRVTYRSGGVATTTRTIIITAPTFTVGSILFSPTAPRSGQVINFDAGGFTVGVGATIEEYTWIWGDGTTETTSSAQAQHTYTIPAPVLPATSNSVTFVVRVTVRDSLDRTQTTTATVVVTNP
jgi:PKD repeat protein